MYELLWWLIHDIRTFTACRYREVISTGLAEDPIRYIKLVMA